MTTKQEKATSGEVTLEKTPTDIVAHNPQSFNIEALISQGIDKGLTVDTMERLLAMRKELKAEWAREQYNKAMAEFQSDCPTIQKNKEVKNDNGKILYSYAPIESIVSQIKAILQKHGFSYSTSMEVLQDGVKVCVKVIHIDGHSEESCMQVPLGTKTGIMSASQQTAAAQTFAKRYAFCNAFGILTGDEDNDGAEIQPPVNVQRGGNKPGIGAPLDDSERITSLIIKDLEACDTYEEYKQRLSDIRIAYENGKLSNTDYSIIVKVCKKVIEKFKKPEVKPLSPAEKMKALGKKKE